MPDARPPAPVTRRSNTRGDSSPLPDVTRSSGDVRLVGAPAAGVAPGASPGEDAMACDRCGTAMFRMHAVWRCPGCGFKTDCCGW